MGELKGSITWKQKENINNDSFGAVIYYGINIDVYFKILRIITKVMGPVKFTFIKKLPRNKRFNYTPRYYKGKEKIDETKYASKFDAYADTLNKNDFSGHWHANRISNRNRSNFGFNRTIWILIALFTLIFLFIIDFDLSIFSSKN